MSYRLFVRMLKAGQQREAFEQLQLVTALSYPHWEDNAARERYRSMLLKAVGMESTGSAEQDMQALKNLQDMFPSPSPEVLALIKREQEQNK